MQARQPRFCCGSSDSDRLARPIGKAWIAWTVGGAVVVALVMTLCLLAPDTITGTPKRVGRSSDKNFPTVHAVDGTPDEWIATVCRPLAGTAWSAGPQYIAPNTVFAVPRALRSAVCRAWHDEVSDPVLLIAEYPSEKPMQIDLADNGINWYCFAAANGKLFVIATRNDDLAKGANGLNGSPVLLPLVAYGFIVYPSPGE